MGGRFGGVYRCDVRSKVEHHVAFGLKRLPGRARRYVRVCHPRHYCPVLWRKRHKCRQSDCLGYGKEKAPAFPGLGVQDSAKGQWSNRTVTTLRRKPEEISGVVVQTTILLVKRSI